MLSPAKPYRILVDHAVAGTPVRTPKESRPGESYGHTLTDGDSVIVRSVLRPVQGARKRTDLVVILQANLTSDLDTRRVAPLVAEDALPALGRL